MPTVQEFRIPLPYTIDEYFVGQLFTINQMSLMESSADEGVEIVENRPFQNEEGMASGQYSHKIYRFSKRLPPFMRKIAGNLLPEFHEISHQSDVSPDSKTVISCVDGPFKDRFQLVIISKHKRDAGETENIHDLPEDQLKHRKVKFLDIMEDGKDSNSLEFNGSKKTPRSFRSAKRSDLNLQPEWYRSAETRPSTYMTCYKLVTCTIKVPLVSSMIEQKLLDINRNIFMQIHRELYCLMDEWIDLTLPQIRALEQETRAMLIAARTGKPLVTEQSGPQSVKSPRKTMQKMGTPSSPGGESGDQGTLDASSSSAVPK